MDQIPDGQWDMSEVMRLAASPAGKKLISLLQGSHGAEMNAAMNSAAKGDYQQAKQTISAFLETQEAQTLLEQLRRE